jgi:translocation and assembly module TamA
VPRCWLAGFLCAWAWACALALAPGCGGKVRVQPQAGETWLEDIRVEGNRSVDDDDLIPKLALRRAVGTGRPIDPHQLALDTGRIRAIYLRLGFFDVAVQARIDDRRGAQTAVFSVVEGRRAKMEVVIKGLPPEVSEAAARALIEIPDGGPFDYDVYDEARLPLQTLVERAGYAHVQLESYVSAERATARAVAIYELSPGPRCTFGPTTVNGATGSLAGAIVNRIAFREGGVYSPAALAATQRDLYELGRFSTVVVEPQRVAGQTVIPVKITVAMGSRHEVRLGGGFGREPETYEARVRAGGLYIPLASPLWALAADARVAATVPGTLSELDEFSDVQPKFRVLASAQRIDLFRPRLGGDIAVGYDFVTVEAYTSTGPRLQVGLSSPLGARWLTARIGWAFSYLWFTDISEIITDSPLATESLRLDAPQRLGMFQATLAADLRDNPLDPRRGAYLSVRVHQGTPYAGGAAMFTQLTPDLRGYLTLGTPRLVLALRARGGAILGDDVPVTERYFSGGAQSHRGFSERALAPTLAQRRNGTVESVVIGGAALLEAGAELRLGLGTLWSLPVIATLFLDGGEVTNDPYLLDPFDLHWAAGAGLAARLAGVKFRVDVGYRLNRKGKDEPRFGENTAVHFGVGDSF